MEVVGDLPLAGLLITGTVGAGKTSVATAVGDLLADAQVPHAVIGLRWHVHRAGELDGILDAAAIEDFTVTTTELSTAEVATEVVRRAGW